MAELGMYGLTHSCTERKPPLLQSPGGTHSPGRSGGPDVRVQAVGNSAYGRALGKGMVTADYSNCTIRCKSKEADVAENSIVNLHIMLRHFYEVAPALQRTITIMVW